MQSIYIKYIVLVVCLAGTTLNAQNWKKVEKNDMIVEWRIDQNKVWFRMAAKTQGWLALGFNTEDELKGSSLIMAASVKGSAGKEANEKIEEHYIIQPGNHKNVADLNKKTILSDTKVSVEDAMYTMARFALPLNHTWDDRIALVEGKKYYFILAYSVSDDFDHHSSMRTTVQVTL